MSVRLSRTLAVLLALVAALSALTAWRYVQFARSLDVDPYDGGTLTIGLADSWGGVGASMSVQVWSIALVVLLLVAATVLAVARQRPGVVVTIGLVALALAVPLLSGLGPVFSPDTAMISARSSLGPFRLAAAVSIGLSVGALLLAARVWRTTTGATRATGTTGATGTTQTRQGA